jgi:two-component SAPR family response regulator
MTEKTNFDKFREEALANYDAYYNDPKTLKTVEIANTLEEVILLQNRLNYNALVHCFGEQLGEHLWHSFVGNHNRNLVSWISNLTGEFRFYILYQLRNDPHFLYR